MRLGLLLLAIASGCVAAGDRAPARPGSDPGATPLTPLVRWREAERRRDLAAAEQVLAIRDARTKQALEGHFAALATVPAGPVRSELEFRLVSGPAPWGDSLYMALEPDGEGHSCVVYSLVGGGANARLAFDVPPWDTLPLEADRRAGAARTARREHWARLRGKELEREVRKLRWILESQVAAVELAQSEGLRLRRFSPDPGRLLEELEHKDPEAVRQLVLTWLAA